MINYVSFVRTSQRKKYYFDFEIGAINLLSKRTYDSMVDARALLSDWNGLMHTSHWPRWPPVAVYCVSASSPCPIEKS